MRYKLTGKVLGFLVFWFLSLVSCQSEKIHLQEPESHPVEVGFYVGGAQTRTEMLDDGLHAIWSDNDQISVWAKNSAGAFALNNQIFTTYGLDGSYGFFTSTLSSAMDEGTYTYYSCYPVPDQVNGSKVFFDIPAIQDGKVSEGADVMISYPKTHGALTPVPDPEDHSGMSMVMKRMMHQFRFYIPASNTVIGDETLQRIVLDFPTGIVGRAMWDMENPDAAPVLSEPSTKAELSLAEPLGISDQNKDYACFAFVPTKFTEGQKMKIKAYTEDKIVYFDDVDLCARDFQAGHSTPVRLNVKSIADFPYRITFDISQNNLGENVNKLILTAPEGCRWDDAGSNVYTYEPGRKFSTGETISLRFEDKAQYRAFSGKDIKVTYDSEHAITSQTVRIPDLSSVNVTKVTLQVPYLLYQDFNSISTYSDGHDNPGVGGTASDTYKGITELSGIGLPGWYGTRIGIQGGVARICCRFENIAASAYYKGRLYTPQLTNIKEDEDVKIKVSFKYGSNRNEKRKFMSSSKPDKTGLLYMGFNSQSEVVNPDISEGDFMDQVAGLVAGSGYASMTPSSLSPKVINGQELDKENGAYNYLPKSNTIITESSVDRNMRIGWILSTNNDSFGTHANYWFYIDEIKVQITK